jgi:uncharacterized protein YbjT (DUF2867 family)
MNQKDKKTLVTGATGYIGGRLVPRLIEKGYSVRCLARHPEHLMGMSWAKNAEIIKGDLYKNENLSAALAGVDTAYYLIHSMADVPDFERMDETSATNFAQAAGESQIKRIVYLGGLGRGENLSRHLRSRQRVGELLRASGISCTEFRAAIIVGSGSVSFEMIRYLVERLPVILCCRHLDTKCQPIAIRDVLSYLINCLENEESKNKIIEIGGSSVHAYRDLLKIYAEVRNLKIKFLNLHFWSPRMYSKFIGSITPIPSIFIAPLLESLLNDVICHDDRALKIFPEIKPLDYRTAVQYALRRIVENAVETTWTMAINPMHKEPYVFVEKEGLSADDRFLEVKTDAQKVFEIFTGIGGERGYFYANWLWNLRAFIDRVVGGIGMRRGRRHPEIIRQGEPLDFWRVERVIPGRFMLLRAEMRLPGKGWLQFESIPKDDSSCILRQTAYFEPRGFLGSLYWYLLYPVHRNIFAGLISEIKKKAEHKFRKK